MTTLLANSKKVQFSGKAKEITASAHFRLMILLLVFLAAFTIIVGRLVSLTILEDATPYRASSSAFIPPRGDIVDRNGVPLARTTPAQPTFSRSSADPILPIFAAGRSPKR